MGREPVVVPHILYVRFIWQRKSPHRGNSGELPTYLTMAESSGRYQQVKRRAHFVKK